MVLVWVLPATAQTSIHTGLKIPKLMQFNIDQQNSNSWNESHGVVTSNQKLYISL